MRYTLKTDLKIKVKKIVRIGTRGSSLALWQAILIENLLKDKFPEIALERIIITTEGDRDQNSSLTQIGGQGIFTKAIEAALLDKRIDIAVHSLKDLPSDMSYGLALAAVPERGPVEDVLITPDGLSYDQLTSGAKIASGSIRRRSQLLRLRPDVNFTDLRGNIDTRLKKLNTQNLDGIIMARAALKRLQIEGVKYSVFSVDEMIPSVGQGAVGVQIRSDSTQLKSILSKINHKPTYQAVTAERAFLHQLDSGCQFPVGAYARIEEKKCILRGFVGSEDGKEIIIQTLCGEAGQAEDLGRKLARKFIEKGALEILNPQNAK